MQTKLRRLVFLLSLIIICGAAGDARAAAIYGITILNQPVLAVFGTGAFTVLDYDGDRKTDYAVYRPGATAGAAGTAFVQRSTNNSFFAQAFGTADTDIQTPGDFDGDTRTDIAVWRSTNGTFYVLRSSDNIVVSVPFGMMNDEPVARDYNGDGRTDYAVVRRQNGALTWYVLTTSNNAFSATRFGADTDVVAPGDYDGDGRSDLGVFRGAFNNPATFYVQGSASGFRSVQFGLGSDLIVPGDYDGDNKTDFAVLRTQGTTYTWFILRSVNNTTYGVQFGGKPQFSAQGDYDGDGRTDIATFNPLNGTFYVIQSLNGAVTQRRFGQNGDFPIAAFDTH